MGKVLGCAKMLEIALAAVEKREPEKEGGEMCEALKKTREVNKSLEEIQDEFDKESGRDPNVVLRALQVLKSTWASVEELADFNLRLVKVFGELEKRLCEALAQTVVTSNLTVIKEELAKDAGFHPKRIL